MCDCVSVSLAGALFVVERWKKDGGEKVGECEEPQRR